MLIRDNNYKIRCDLLNSAENSDMRSDSGFCYGTQVAKELVHKSTERCRIDEAKKLMIQGKRESWVLPKNSDLNIAKPSNTVSA